MCNNFDVSIVIINYNTANLIKECIGSIDKHTKGLIYEIIIVDNDSSEDDKAILSSFLENENINIVFSDSNLGFGRACNLGVKNSEGRNVIFLNPDTILINNALLCMSVFLDNNPSVGACGANLYNENKDPNLSYKMEFPGCLAELKQLLPFELGDKLHYGVNYMFNYTDKPIKVACITGADLMIPRNVLSRVGLFDRDFFMYYEDTELCWRIRNKGYNLVCLPDAKIIHLEGRSFTNLSFARLNRVFLGRSVFYAKTGSKYQFFFANAFIICSYLLRVILFALLFNKQKLIESTCKIKLILSFPYNKSVSNSNCDYL